MKEQAAANTFYSGIYANIQYTPIPKRERLSEEFINEALEASKLYQAEIHIDRLKYKICIQISFNFDTSMKSISRLFGMADVISFSKNSDGFDITAHLDFYTHVVVKNGMAVAP